MKLVIALVALVLLTVTLAGCGRGGGGAKSPKARATATAEALAAQTPTPTTVPTSTPTATAAVPTPTPTDSITLPQLFIAVIPSDVPSYDRADWRHWIDVDSDCQNTRAEVLIAESLVFVSFTNEQQCTVVNGQWLALFTGVIVEVAGDLDIDHMVPLANAHQSGGWAWSADKKKDYANDLSFDGHLIAVTASANRSKGARGPDEWQPPDPGYWCDYAVDWIRVKAAWGLTATAAEWIALESMLGTCSVEVVIEPGGVTPTPEPATPTVPPVDGPSVVNSVAAGVLFVTEMMPNPSAVSDTAGEWFEVYNASSDVAVDINLWNMRDLDTNSHVIDNGGPLVVPPLGFVVLGRNSDSATNGGVPVDYQYSSFTLGNSDDEIQLIDLSGTVVDTVVYDSSLVFNGASTILNPSTFTALANDSAANWCTSVTLLAGGDRGTPGAPNDSC